MARAPANSMSRLLLLWCLGCLSLPVVGAEEAEQLDADFLEYLANLEGDDDDWTLIAKAEEPPPGADPERRIRNPSQAAKEAAKKVAAPAVDER
jgi:hypothetical protein